MVRVPRCVRVSLFGMPCKKGEIQDVRLCSQKVVSLSFSLPLHAPTPPGAPTNIRHHNPNYTVLPVERHRYRFGGRRWTKEEYNQHLDQHAMVLIQPLPHDAALLRRFAPV